MLNPPKRKSDAIISVCQNNDEKSIWITQLNETATAILGYTADEVVGEELREFVADNVKESIRDFLEFEEGGADLADVMRKVRNFSLRTKDGQFVPLEMKIYYGDTAGKHQVFELVLRDLTVQNSMRAGRHTGLALKGYEVTDPVSGMPDRSSFLKDMEMVRFYIEKDYIYASLALISIDDYESVLASHGQEAANLLVKEIATRCTSALRQEDSVGSLAPNQLGTLLVGADGNAAGIALNRLRWSIRSLPIEIAPGRLITPSVSIAFTEISLDKPEDLLMQQCETVVMDAVQRGGNQILPAHG